MHFLLNLMFLVTAIKWGDWKNWRTYYPTWLFFIGGDLFKNALLHDHPFWTYKETILGSRILFGHLIIDILIITVAYSSTLLIYLGKFPTQRLKQIGWVLFWVAIYSLIEFINLNYLNLIEHHNGWNMFWSILFNLVMFTVLKIHLEKPLIAWLISLIFLSILLYIFHVPSWVFK
ncbi:CBO0543 family protein [Paenibacillus sp. BSR1-1]|uniref:CBO0543 family protein n=1 Tax=Paenibacillus sp. BSR1-1 TaxID=3020845 RepID=UPI00339D64E3